MAPAEIGRVTQECQAGSSSAGGRGLEAGLAPVWGLGN